MRQMKYLRLFEAFDSVQLSKTMKFVSPKDKDRFISTLKSVCDSIDAPLSKLNDDNFQYLPYKKAVSLKSSDEMLECPSCKGEGKRAKAWGRGTRMVKCEKCDGAGKIDPPSKIKYIKFWFNSDGRFIGTTAVDGRYHSDKKDTANYVKKDISDDVRTLSVPEIKSKYGIVNGETRLFIQNMRRTGWRGGDNAYSQLGVAFIDRDGRLYVVHGNGSIDYGQPVGRKWKDYGRYATNIKSILGSDEGARLFLMTDVEEKEDIYWNAPLNASRYGVSIDSSMSRDFLKEAHFAIVFDYDSFAYNGTDWNPVSITKGDRKEARKGALALKSDEEIKSENIERYIKRISNIDLSEGMGRLISKVPMIFGGDLALYFIYGEKNFSRFKNMMSDVYSFMSAEDDEERIEANRKISERLRDVRDTVTDATSRIRRRIDNSRVQMSEREHVIKLIDKLDELSQKINQKLLRGKMESIEDMEVMMMKAIGIHSALRSDRFDLSYEVRNYIGALDSTGWRSDSSYLEYLRSLSSESVDRSIRKIDLISNVIERL